MGSTKETISVPGDPAGVEQLRLFVREVLGRLSLPEESVYHLELAVTEACINIIRYGYAQTSGDIGLAVWLEADRIYFEVRDSGRPFDPRQVEPPNLERYIREEIKGGFGVFFMRRLMEGLDYRREEGQNVLTMWKALRPSPAPPPD